MKSLVVYYSLEGSTKRIAQILADKIGGDILELVPQKAYPTGKVSKFYFGGKSAVMGESPILNSYAADLNKYDILVIGTPVWASRCTPPIRSFLKQESVIGKKLYAYACAGGTSAGKTFEQIEELSGKNLLSKKLFVAPFNMSGEQIEKEVAEFAKSII